MTLINVNDKLGYALRRRVLVLLNGEDITRDCYAFDLETGEAHCLVRDADGQPTTWRAFDGSVDALRVVRRGRLEVKERP